MRPFGTCLMRFGTPFSTERLTTLRASGQTSNALKGQGFELQKLKNSWSNEEYKGINSQWIEPDSGQRFEVQFHTRISFEAKQLTHDAYEATRTNQVDEFEELVWKLSRESHLRTYQSRPARLIFLTTRREARCQIKSCTTQW